MEGSGMDTVAVDMGVSKTYMAVKHLKEELNITL